jgi:hypothetical protein
MDRSSVATTVSLHGSESLSSSTGDFYDTPRQVCPCCAPTAANAGCPCCNVTTSVPVPMHPQNLSMQMHHQHQNPMQQQVVPVQQQHHHSHYQNPSCIMRRPDPMENYDVPPHNNPHNVGILNNPNPNANVLPSSTTISINGEGKMPLVAGSMGSNGARPNPNAIYAQVDKSKKTPRPPPPTQQQQPHQHIYSNSNCDSHPIYENRNIPQSSCGSQPTYINLAPPVISNEQILPKAGSTGKPPAPDPTAKETVPNPACPHGHSNYVNLDFAQSLQLYENAKEIASKIVLPTADANATQHKVLVHSEPQVPESIDTAIVENEYENTKPNEEIIAKTEETKDSLSEEGTQTEKSSCATTRSNSLSVDEATTTTTTGSTTTGSGVSGVGSSRGNSQEDASSAASLPLRRSSSVPCKGGHANRGSASSSDSGVSGDGGLFFDDSSPMNDIGR